MLVKLLLGEGCCRKSEALCLDARGGRNVGRDIELAERWKKPRFTDRSILAPISPRPRTREPSDTTATVLPRFVSS